MKHGNPVGNTLHLSAYAFTLARTALLLGTIRLKDHWNSWMTMLLHPASLPVPLWPPLSVLYLWCEGLYNLDHINRRMPGTLFDIKFDYTLINMACISRGIIMENIDRSLKASEELHNIFSLESELLFRQTCPFIVLISKEEEETSLACLESEGNIKGAV